MWFRRDLRLDDNPAWNAAVATGHIVRPLFVLDPRLYRPGHPRSARLVAELRELDAALARGGGRLQVIPGDPTQVVPEVARGAGSVHLNRDVSAYATDRDARVGRALGELGVELDGHWGNLVQPPGAVLTKAGQLSKVFTPFHRRWAELPWRGRLATAPMAVTGDTGLELPQTDVAGGRAAALDRLDRFVARRHRYADDRDTPAIEGTSQLSVDLKFGVLSPIEIIDALGESPHHPFVRQLAWRDWWAHTLLAAPHLESTSARAEYDRVQWLDDRADIERWSLGQTGYPLVDAGMRELRATGLMHNRVRMVAASFLVKHLLVDWRIGERIFRDLLIDADPAQNIGNWQWVAGVGPDAAPYFRIFNPVTQSRRHDPGGDYLRRWLPELSALGDRAIHAPWEQGPLDLAAHGVILDDSYPAPIVDHDLSRARALAAYRAAVG